VNPMSLAPFLRSVGSHRRFRPTPVVVAEAGAVRPELPSCHPAMRGIAVSPVHGWHCICDRCAAQSRHQA
jgi:hypothetical protein